MNNTYMCTYIHICIHTHTHTHTHTHAHTHTGTRTHTHTVLDAIQSVRGSRCLGYISLCRSYLARWTRKSISEAENRLGPHSAAQSEMAVTYIQTIEYCSTLVQTNVSLLQSFRDQTPQIQKQNLLQITV